MSYKKMMRWGRTHRKGVRQAWCGFHTGLHEPKAPPREGTREHAVSEAFHEWRRIALWFKERGRDRTPEERQRRRECIHEAIASYRAKVTTAEAIQLTT